MRTQIHSTILALLYKEGSRGMTYKELCAATKKDHGTISGALSLLHEAGGVFYLHETRGNCHVYVHANFKTKFDTKDRVDYPRKSMAPRYLKAIEDIVNAYKTGEGLQEAINRAERYL